MLVQHGLGADDMNFLFWQISTIQQWFLWVPFQGEIARSIGNKHAIMAQVDRFREYMSWPQAHASHALLIQKVPKSTIL